jgi:hypothetical protein
MIALFHFDLIRLQSTLSILSFSDITINGISGSVSTDVRGGLSGGEKRTPRSYRGCRAEKLPQQLPVKLSERKSMGISDSSLVTQGFFLHGHSPIISTEAGR